MMSQKFLHKTLAVSFLMHFLFFSSTSFSEEMKQKSYAQFNSMGELIRPTGYREWIYIGSPVTPNDMNNGKAAFPEFHNVYIDPVSWEFWKKNNKFSDGTLIVKELVSVGSKKAASGKGYFQGKYIGLEASIKSKKHFPNSSGNWGFFRFTVEGQLQLRKTSIVQAEENCMTCHKLHANTDQVFTQYYPVLRAASGMGELGTGGK